VSEREFTWIDGERLVRYGDGALDDLPRLLHERGFEAYALLATERSLEHSSGLRKRAATVVSVPSGPVPEAAAAVRERVRRLPVVALGGGRVVDSAKAVAAVDGVPCAAIPTTLSGAEMTPFHRLPAGTDGVIPARPSLVVCVPALMASQPMPDLAASAMNALAHAVESLYVGRSNPVCDMAALRAAELLAHGLAADPPTGGDLALGAVLAGYAVGATGYGVHHVVSQTTVRVTGASHAGTNAVMLPHVVRLMARRAPDELGRLALALGGDRQSPSLAAGLVSALAERTGRTRLSELGVEESALGRIAAEASARPQLDHTPSAPGEEELLDLLRSAL
jgi:alcohol dehydrogenase class IV